MKRLGMLALTWSVTLSLATALLLVSSPGAQAAKAGTGSWGSYLWPTTETCTYTGESSGSTSTDIVRSGSKATLVSLGYPSTYKIAGSSLRYTHVSSWGSTDIAIREAFAARYPSPTSLAHRAHGSATWVTTFRYSKKAAKSEGKKYLTSGRKITITGRYRIVGLGTRTISVGGQNVKAVGAKTVLTSVKVAHAKAKWKRRIANQFRPLYKIHNTTEWWAPGLGQVSLTLRAVEGSPTRTLVSCS
ncbi:MAG: hypothetical protein QM572_10245 [Nocardioides sp.]|uniref:hypothetical protein n=1 Tax=Nocardioides sp. TaxID=35761 RepID=UPI0039E3ABEF